MSPQRLRAFYEGKMRYFTILEIHSGGAVCGSGDNYCDITNPTVPVMKPTGLIVEGGKEVWEGDVVSIVFPEGKFRNKLVEWVSEFVSYSIQPYLIHNELQKQLTNPTIFMIHVVGNAYENPELLT